MCVCVCLCLFVFQTGRNRGVRKRRKCFSDIICWWPTLWGWDSLPVKDLWIVLYYEALLVILLNKQPCLVQCSAFTPGVRVKSISMCTALINWRFVFLVIKLQSWYKSPFHKTNQKNPKQKPTLNIATYQFPFCSSEETIEVQEGDNTWNNSYLSSSFPGENPTFGDISLPSTKNVATSSAIVAK